MTRERKTKQKARIPEIVMATTDKLRIANRLFNLFTLVKDVININRLLIVSGKSMHSTKLPRKVYRHLRT